MHKSKSELGTATEGSTARTEAPAFKPPVIILGIEWFTVTEKDGATRDEHQCARCGSSVEWADCWNCEDGLVEYRDTEDFGNETSLRDCEFCRGRGGRLHCMSTPDYCEAHPMPGRRDTRSTAMPNEFWHT